MSDYFDLGSYRFPVTTASTEAQVWFDRRLAWTYGFNHEEAVACFEKVLGADSGCCMGHRGLAYAVGPNCNKPWADFGGEERAACLACGRSEAGSAVTCSQGATAVEKALCAALVWRYPEVDDGDWAWMQPTRHALGALPMEQGRCGEAEAVCRADLGFDATLRRPCQHPDNVLSLHGLHECLIRRRDTVEAPIIKQRLDLAAARCDVPVHSPCY